MKRGKIYPQVRSKWVWPETSTFNKSLPCWISSNFLYWFVKDTADPGLITIVGPNPKLIQWTYIQAICGVEWRRTWVGADPAFTGEITYRQQVDPSGKCLGTLIQHFKWTGTPAYEDTWSRTFLDFGFWNVDGTGFGSNFGRSEVSLTRLPFWDIAIPIAQRYQQLHVAGIDSHDTAPISWNG